MNDMSAVEAVPGSPGDFVADTQLRRVSGHAGRYRGDVPDGWQVRYLFGGITFAVALRAAVIEMQETDQRLLAASGIFCSPVPPGELTVDVERLRTGRAGSQLQARLYADDAPSGFPAGPALVVTAAFGRRGEGPSFTERPVPQVPKPQEIPAHPADASRWPIRFHDSVEWRRVVGHEPWEPGWEPGPAHAVSWMGYRKPPRLADGSVDPLAVVPPADSLGWAMMQRVGPDAPPMFIITLDMTVHFLADPTRDWFLQEMWCQHAGDGYASGDLYLWDESETLIAYATQRAMLRPALFMEGAETPPE